MSRMRKQSRQKSLAKLREEAWKVFSLWVKKRDSDWRGYGNCITCKTKLLIGTSEAHAGHFVHGVTKRTYFCERNVNLQCRSCNFYKDGARDLYALRLIEKYGDGIIQEIHSVNKNRSPWTKNELIEIKEKYETLTRNS